MRGVPLPKRDTALVLGIAGRGAQSVRSVSAARSGG